MKRNNYIVASAGSFLQLTVFLIISAFCNGLCLFLFYWDFTNYYLYLIFRFCNGIFQSFVSIYLPAWCNQFGIKERRTIMLGLVQIGVPLGVVIGYGVTVWALSFFGTNKDNLKTGVSIYTYIYIIYSGKILIAFKRLRCGLL